MASNKTDYTGMQAGILTALQPTNEKKHGAVLWLFRCACGVEKKLRACDVFTKRGRRSCGCSQKRLSIETRKKPNAGFQAQFVRYRVNAKSRKIPFDLDLTAFMSIARQDCYYCGVAPEDRKNAVLNAIAWEVRARSRNVCIDEDYYSCVMNGVDRVDNSKGYSSENCVSACQTCNLMKWKHNQGEWVSHIKRIAKHLEKSS